MSDSVRVYFRADTMTHHRLYRVSKRVFDLFLCLMALTFLLPILLLIALVIALDSPGNVLYLQDRVGKNGRIFRMVKFRTMAANYNSQADRDYMAQFVSGKVTPTTNESGTITYKPAHSSHVTRVGRILRKTSLDELPQIWNVLRGDMSIVGPRPNVTWEVEMYADWHRERLQVLPGITGLAQVRGRSNITFDNIVEYDLKYIRNRSFKLDMQILWWTLEQVLARRDAA
jgi:lipopolysaccharide/colanic/teichoic acid biosynthesis glycosyltransferase